jgi:glycerol-3-phosphate dehydrogenase
MAQRVMNLVLKNMKAQDTPVFRKSETENIQLVTPALHSSSEVNQYLSEVENKLIKLGITDAYHAWYFCTTYGKQSDLIIDKAKAFKNTNTLERLIRAELWFCIHYEMTNNLSDFFVRRTGRLYFNISSITKYMDIVLNDIIFYLNWDQERTKYEKEKMNLLLQDATTYYDKEFT